MYTNEKQHLKEKMMFLVSGGMQPPPPTHTHFHLVKNFSEKLKQIKYNEIKEFHLVQTVIIATVTVIQ